MYGMGTQIRKWWVRAGGALALVALSLAWTAGRGAAASLAPPATPVGRGMMQAGRDGKYSFVLFYRANDRASETMKGTFEKAQGRLGEQGPVLLGGDQFEGPRPTW